MAGDVDVHGKVKETSKNIRRIFEVLKECLAKNRVLLDSIQGSQARSHQSTKEYNVLHSLKGRLAASQGTNETLSSELYSLDVKLAELVEILNLYDKEVRDREIETEKGSYFVDETAANEEKTSQFSDNIPKETKESNELATELEQEFERNNGLQNSMNKSDIEKIEKNDVLSILLESNTFLQQQLGESTEYFEKEVKRLQDKHKEEERYLNDVFTQLAEVKEKSEKYKRLYEVEKQKNLTSHSHEGKNGFSALGENPVWKDGRGERSGVVNRRSSLDSRLLTGRSRKENHVMIRASTAGLSAARAKLLLQSSEAIKSYEALSSELNNLREEVHNLKLQNARLTKKATEATSQLFYMKNQLCVHQAERVELQRRMDKFKEENRRLERTLSKRANKFVEGKKMERQLQEEIKWSQLAPASVLGSHDRSANSATSKRQTTGQSRNIPVERWAEDGPACYQPH